MIYVLFSCNIHKEYSSMRYMGATTDLMKIKLELQRLLKIQDAEFNNGPENFNPHDNWRVYDLNSQFDYVYIEETADGIFI